jgi:2-amino-4-hydroxy-6-hydroxymethyldihydropteridine diphosphokinase
MQIENKTITSTGIALGSNLGDRQKNIEQAFTFLTRLSINQKILRSRIIETDPLDCPAGSGRFLNAVAEIDYKKKPEDLLAALREFENSVGGARPDVRNAPRIIDLDILYFGSQRLNQPGLVIPHPRMLQRRFVLEPLSEIRPELILPGQAESVRTLCQRLDELESATPSSRT